MDIEAIFLVGFDTAGYTPLKNSTCGVKSLYEIIAGSMRDVECKIRAMCTAAPSTMI
jgi:hypothetical protein